MKTFKQTKDKIQKSINRDRNKLPKINTFNKPKKYQLGYSLSRLNQLDEEIEDNIEDAERHGYNYLDTDEGRSKLRQRDELF